MAHLPISIDRSSDVPVGAQLAWQLRALIASGEVAEGERLPGVREMAALAGVNVNTVRSVYGRLADEGAIALEHGRGTFVRGRAAAQETLDRMASAFPGAAPRLAPAPPPGADEVDEAGTAEARRRASLRAEIALLERELAALEVAANGNGDDAPPLHWTKPPAPQLLGAEELDRIRDELVARLVPLRANRDLARHARDREEAERVERDIERHKTEPVRRQRAIATSTPRFESGAGGWSLRWRG
jgi:GntR family transcriptional regulator